MAAATQTQKNATQRSDGLARASDAFKRYILTQTAEFEDVPKADLFRVNQLGRMLDQCDELMDRGMSAEQAINQTMRIFSDLCERMRAEGFEERDTPQDFYRWPLLSETEAEKYIENCHKASKKRALGIAFCTGCVMPVLLLLGTTEQLLGFVPDAVAAAGAIAMLGMIALGVYTIITAGDRGMHREMRDRRFSISRKLRKTLLELQDAVKKKAARRRARGIALEIFCVAPTILGMMLDSAWGSEAPMMIGTAGMFAMIAAGVYDIVSSGSMAKPIRELLLHAEYKE